MAEVLVLVDHVDGTPKKVSYELLTLAKTLGNQAETRDVRIAAAEALRHYRDLGVARVLAGALSGRDFSIAWQSRRSLAIMTGADHGYDERRWLEFLTGPESPLG